MNTIPKILGVSTVLLTAYLLFRESQDNSQLPAVANPEKFVFVASDFRTVNQSKNIDYWSFGSFSIPDNLIVSEIVAEIYDENGNQVLQEACAWVVQNPLQQYAVAIYCNYPATFNIRIVAKCVNA